MPGHDFTTGEVLTAANMDAYCNNSFYGQFRQTVAQSITSGATTALTFTTGEDFDTESGHDAVTNNTRFTCQTAGVYELTGGFSFAGDTTGQRYGLWYKNGAVINGGSVRGPGSANATILAMRSLLVTLAVSDYIELFVHQNTAGALLTLVSTDSMSTFSVKRWSS